MDSTLRMLGLPPQDRRKAQDFFSAAREKTKPGSGYTLPMGFTTNGLMHVCAFLAARETGSSAYSDIQGQKAACCSLKEFRKAIHTVSAALALDAPEKSTKKSPLKRTASSSASSSKQNVSTTKTPNVTVVRTLEGLCKRYGVEAACLGTGLDYGVFLDDVARVENLLKEQGWGETLWDPVRGNVVTCVVFKWVCRELELKVRIIIAQELQVDPRTFDKLIKTMDMDPFAAELRGQLQSKRQAPESEEEDAEAEEDVGDEPMVPTEPQVQISPPETPHKRKVSSTSGSEEDIISPNPKRQKVYRPSRLAADAPKTPSARRGNAAEFAAVTYASPQKGQTSGEAAEETDSTSNHSRRASGSKTQMEESERPVTPSKSAKRTPSKLSTSSMKSKTPLKKATSKVQSPFQNLLQLAEKAEQGVTEEPRYRPVFPDRDFYRGRKPTTYEDQELELEKWKRKALMELGVVQVDA